MLSSMIIIIVMTTVIFWRRKRDQTAVIGIIIWSMAPLPVPASESSSPVLLILPPSPLNICTTCKASSAAAKVLGRYPNWRKRTVFPYAEFCNCSNHSLLACHLSNLVKPKKHNQPTLVWNIEKPEVPEQPAHQWSSLNPNSTVLLAALKKHSIQHICIRTLDGLGLQENVPHSLLSMQIYSWSFSGMCDDAPIMLDKDSSIHTSVWPFHANCWNHFLNHIIPTVSFFLVAIDHFRHWVTSISIHTCSLSNRLFHKWPHSNFSIKGAVSRGVIVTRASNGTQKHHLDQVILVLGV